MFDIVFERTFDSEGGFTANPKDRGNWDSGKVGVGELKGTKFGISAMSYPGIDIKNLTENQAKAIYYDDWWIGLDMDLFSQVMQFQMFDAAFNHGMRNASKIFQRAVGANPDGIIGNQTMRAAAMIKDDNDRCYRFIAERIRFFTKIKTFDEFGKGWMNRMADNLYYASEDN